MDNEAYEDNPYEEEENPYYIPRKFRMGRFTRHSKPKEFKPNPLYYHMRVKIIEEKSRTEKAVLLRLYLRGELEVWIPLRWCKRWDVDSVYIWRPGLISIVKKEWKTRGQYAFSIVG